MVDAAPSQSGKADAVAALAGSSPDGGAAGGDAADPQADTGSGSGSPLDAAPGQAPAPAAPASTVTPAAALPAAAGTGAADTVASLAASISQRLDARISRFDVALNPLGLGRVDVRLEIDARGRTTAALSFDRSEAATLLQSHAGELRAALSQAGLDVAPDALSFDVAQGGAGGQGQAGQGGSGQDAPSFAPAGRGAGAFSSAAAALDAAPVAYASARAARGYDIRI